MKDLSSKLVDREHELERKRTRALARQQWADVIETEARLSECGNFRKMIVEDALLTAKPSPTTILS